MVARQRYVLDANVLAAIVNSDDLEHFSCYSFFRNLHDQDKAIWVVPGLIFFEFQATQSRRKQRPGQSVFRHTPLSYENAELYHVTKKFLAQTYRLGLYDKFRSLRGADLLYACIAKVEDLPLVTHDKDFDPYQEEIKLIRPRDLIRRTGSVTVQEGERVYTVGYEAVHDDAGGTVRLDTGQATHIGGLTAKSVARLLLSEMINSGQADKLKLWRPREKH